MKKKLGSFFLFLIMLSLLVGVVLFAYVIYEDLFKGDTVQTLHANTNSVVTDQGIETSTKIEKKNPIETITDIFTNNNDKETIEYTNTNSSGNFYYEQLSDAAKTIYNGLQDNKQNIQSGDYSIEYGNTFYELLSKENGDTILGDDFQSAVEAFTHDNSDLFFLNVQGLYLNIQTNKRVLGTTYNVSIKPQEGRKYYTDGFESKEQVLNAINKLETYKNYIKSQATNNTYNNIKMIHDFIINNTEYDQNYENKNRYNVYGALVEKKCVCEGYARAFKYLADAIGIENILMQGTATNSQMQVENHAWNAVKIANSWYLIDVTWDDPIIIGNGYLPKNTHYKYFLKGTNSFYKDHKLETQITRNGKTYKYPEISETDY